MVATPAVTVATRNPDSDCSLGNECQWACSLDAQTLNSVQRKRGFSDRLLVVEFGPAGHNRFPGLASALSGRGRGGQPKELDAAPGLVGQDIWKSVAPGRAATGFTGCRARGWYRSPAGWSQVRASSPGSAGQTKGISNRLTIIRIYLYCNAGVSYSTNPRNS
jgi:hypothetical protein